jgi:hypothetical protein
VPKALEAPRPYARLALARLALRDEDAAAAEAAVARGDDGGRAPGVHLDLGVAYRGSDSQTRRWSSTTAEKLQPNRRRCA